MCEIWPDAVPLCSGSATCTDAGTWQVTAYGRPCPTCPIDSPSSDAGSACAVGSVCTYRDAGEICQCTERGGKPSSEWTCQVPEPGCESRPVLGSRCTGAPDKCIYYPGECAFYETECVRGVWRGRQVNVCPP